MRIGIPRSDCREIRDVIVQGSASPSTNSTALITANITPICRSHFQRALPWRRARVEVFPCVNANRASSS